MLWVLWFFLVWQGWQGCCGYTAAQMLDCAVHTPSWPTTSGVLEYVAMESMERHAGGSLAAAAWPTKMEDEGAYYTHACENYIYRRRDGVEVLEGRLFVSWNCADVPASKFLLNCFCSTRNNLATWSASG